MLGKLVDGALVTPSEYEKKKLVITNPSDDVLKYVLKYKDLVIDEEPEYDDMTQYLEIFFEETDTKIIQKWNIKNITDESNENIYMDIED